MCYLLPIGLNNIIRCYLLAVGLNNIIMCYSLCDAKNLLIPKRDFIFARVEMGQTGT